MKTKLKYYSVTVYCDNFEVNYDWTVWAYSKDHAEYLACHYIRGNYEIDGCQSMRLILSELVARLFNKVPKKPTCIED